MKMYKKECGSIKRINLISIFLNYLIWGPKFITVSKYCKFTTCNANWSYQGKIVLRKKNASIIVYHYVYKKFWNLLERLYYTTFIKLHYICFIFIEYYQWSMWITILITNINNKYDYLVVNFLVNVKYYYQLKVFKFGEIYFF